jgi:hypothetical protein
MPITLSNRTATTVTLTGSGFSGLGTGAYIRTGALDVLTEQTNPSLLSNSWTVILSVSSSGGNYIFATYTVSKGGVVSIVETDSFSVSGYLEPSLKQKQVTINSLSKAGAKLKLRSPSRRNFPSI